MSKHRGIQEESGTKEPHFAHASEREFARILDFYDIEWQYEPRTFVLRTDPDGNPLESFAPDFYLPEQDLFVELTTLRQKLVTKKNRKLRRLRELYPTVNIKLFYNRDFRSLMTKYDISFESGEVAGNGHSLEGDGATEQEPASSPAPQTTNPSSSTEEGLLSPE